MLATIDYASDVENRSTIQRLSTMNPSSTREGGFFVRLGLTWGRIPLEPGPVCSAAVWGRPGCLGPRWLDMRVNAIDAREYTAIAPNLTCDAIYTSALGNANEGMQRKIEHKFGRVRD